MNKLRLILGDQLNINHSWFRQNEPNIFYVLMEIRSETDYVKQRYNSFYLRITAY